MAGAGKKTFTAGETLTASDVNTYLMEQSVMYFGGTAARASAIPTPSTGMTSYIGVTGTATIPQLETYTGSAWQTPYGVTLLANVAVTSASTIAINNVFSANYDSYQIILSNLSGSGNPALKLTTGGTPNSSNYQEMGSGGYTPGSVLGFSGNYAGTAFTVASATGTNRSGAIINLVNPFLAVATFGTTSFAIDDGSNVYGTYKNLIHRVATSYDGIQITGGTFTMTVRIYGLRNS